MLATFWKSIASRWADHSSFFNHTIYYNKNEGEFGKFISKKKFEDLLPEVKLEYTKITNHVDFIKNHCNIEEVIYIKTEHGYANVVGKPNRPATVLEGNKKTGIIVGSTHSDSKLVEMDISEITGYKSYINPPIIYKLNTDLKIDKKNWLDDSIVESLKHTLMVHSLNDESPTIIIQQGNQAPRFELNYKGITYIQALESVNPELAEGLRGVEPIVNKHEFRREVFKWSKIAKNYMKYIYDSKESEFKVSNYDSDHSGD